MPSVRVDFDKVREFKTGEQFYKWLARSHDSEDELWIKIHKVGSGLKSITLKEAIDVVLCWGWIDGIRKSHDDKSYLQRYTPRRKGSIWSRINVQRELGSGLMFKHLQDFGGENSDGEYAHWFLSLRCSPV